MTTTTSSSIFVSVLGALALSAACVGAAIGPAYAAPAKAPAQAHLAVASIASAR